MSEKCVFCNKKLITCDKCNILFSQKVGNIYCIESKLHYCEECYYKSSITINKDYYENRKIDRICKERGLNDGRK
jgi:hypothetical protein